MRDHPHWFCDVCNHSVRLPHVHEPSDATAPSPALAALAMRERAAMVVDGFAIEWDDRDINGSSVSLIAERIRAISTTFTDAELLAAVEQFPAVRALVDAVSHMVSADAWSTEEYRETRPEEIVSTVSNLLYALAPFRK